MQDLSKYYSMLSPHGGGPEINPRACGYGYGNESGGGGGQVAGLKKKVQDFIPFNAGIDFRRQNLTSKVDGSTIIINIYFFQPWDRL